MERSYGRSFDQLRPVKIHLNFLNRVPGSVLIEQGDTKVLITSTVEENVAPFLKGTNTGWITAEYSMLPRSSETRIQRERKQISGRTYEIQRLIGRSLRQAFDLKKIGERTIYVDCDVLQADGGTRTASITGAFVSVYYTLRMMMTKGIINEIPLLNFLAAVSVGKIENEYLLDLDFNEDSIASVDMNIVMTEDEKFVEIQGTAEKEVFSEEEFQRMLELAKKGIKELIGIQRETLSITLSL
uniref:Ribonuclease PH n=1 Tax=candidate division WOR-3 bacterium TaxID=2052148 RepID=A0A7C4YG89_UNCW3